VGVSKLRVLDLFSGIGGFSLGLERTGGFETVAFCEIEPFPRRVLAKHWPEVPCYDDVRTLTADRLEADGITVDVICGGFPCQPFSSGGKRTAISDDRHLWPEMQRLVAAIRPRWVICENVAGFVSVGLDLVLADLEACDYEAWSLSIPACAVGAPHRRERWWIVGHYLGDTDGAPAHPHAKTSEQRGAVSESSRWATEPAVGRMAHGVSGRVDRLKSLGNAVVPQIPELIGRAILQASAVARVIDPEAFLFGSHGNVARREQALAKADCVIAMLPGYEPQKESAK